MGPETQKGESATPEPTQAQAEHEKDDVAPTRIERLMSRSEHRAEQFGKALERPAVGAGVAGALFAAVAGAWGPTEAVLGAAAGLLVYRMLKRRDRKASAKAEADDLH